MPLLYLVFSNHFKFVQSGHDCYRYVLYFSAIFRQTETRSHKNFKLILGFKIFQFLGDIFISVLHSDDIPERIFVDFEKFSR